jgi:integrase
MAGTRTRRGFGRVRQLRSGRWQAAYLGPDNRLHKATKTYAEKYAAEGWLADERRKIDLGTWGAVERSDSITLRAYADRWLKQRTLRPRTRAHYDRLLDRLILPDLGDLKLVALAPARVREWHAGLGTDTPTQTAHAYALLHAICVTAIQDELLDANPCRIRAAMTTKRKRHIEVLNPAQVDALAAAMPAELAASVVLAAWCGLRWGEASELRRKDVTDGSKVLRVRRGVTYRKELGFIVGPPKTDAGIRDVTVPPHIRPVITAHLKQHVGRSADSLLIPPVDGSSSHMRDDQYRKHFVVAREAIDKPNFRFQDLRHTGAVFAAHAGGTDKELMNRIGHTTPAMAQLYQHVAQDRDAMLAERMSQLAVSNPTGAVDKSTPEP